MTHFPVKFFPLFCGV